MVLDNADDLETFGVGPRPLPHEVEHGTALYEYLPRSNKGFLLITTRDARVGETLADRERSIVISPLSAYETQQLFQAKLPHCHEWHEEDTTELLNTLGYLPLAVTQAAAFISENSMLVSEYIEILRASKSDLTELLDEDLHDSRRDWMAQNSVVRTWKVSFDQIRKQKPRAAQLLSLMAVLDRHEIPKWLLRANDESKVAFVTALGVLKAFSLVSSEKGGETFTMHRLVQLSTQRWLDLQDEKYQWQEEAVRLLSERFPNSRQETWGSCEVLFTHAQAVLHYQYTSKSNLLQRATVLQKMGWYDYDQGRYDSALERSTESHKTQHDLLGEEDRETLASLDLVTHSLHSQGNYKIAEEMLRQVIKVRERVLKEGHRYILRSYYKLAEALRQQGKYEEAEKWYRSALNGKEMASGDDEPQGEILTRYNGLATVLDDQGKHGEAEEMYRRVIGGYEKVYGKEHRHTVLSYCNLGSTLYAQGRYEEAEELFRASLYGMERACGKEHPHTLLIVGDLARLFGKQGRFDEASLFFQRACAGLEKVLGPRHPETIRSRKNYAVFLEKHANQTTAPEPFIPSPSSISNT